MHKCNFSPPDEWYAARPQAAIAAPQPTLPVYIPNMTSDGMEYPLWPVWVSCPSCVPCQLPMHQAGQASVRTWRILDCLATTKTIIFIPNPKHSTTPATRKKINCINNLPQLQKAKFYKQWFYRDIYNINEHHESSLALLCVESPRNTLFMRNLH